MTISPGTNFDDPRFRDDQRAPVQRMRDGDYYVADDELSALTRRAVRLLALYEQAYPTDPDIARYLLSQVLGEVGESVDIRAPLRVDYGVNISIGDGSWVNYGLTVLDVAPVRIGKDALHELLLSWLALLSADGEAWLVVLKNLGADSLATWLTGQGWDVSRQASSKGFRVLRVRRGPDGPVDA